jgi:hypothetical protein
MIQKSHKNNSLEVLWLHNLYYKTQNFIALPQLSLSNMCLYVHYLKPQTVYKNRLLIDCNPTKHSRLSADVYTRLNPTFKTVQQPTHFTNKIGGTVKQVASNKSNLLLKILKLNTQTLQLLTIIIRVESKYISD